MKKSWVPLFAVAALGLSACTDARIGGDNPPTPSPDFSVVSGYLGFQLQDFEAESTRSTHLEYEDDYERFEWFNKGSKDERAIIDNPDCNWVLFFNSDLSYYGGAKLQKPDEVSVASNVYVAPRPEVEDITVFPAYALVVLNSDPERIEELDKELAAAGTEAVKKVLTYLNKVDTGDPESLAMYEGYFTMSSNVYRDGDSNEVVALTALNPDGPVFYETQEEAVLPENLTTFYVERLLAKFTLIIQDRNRHFDTDKPIVVDGEGRIKVRMEYASTDKESKDIMTNWKVNLVNWGLNGLEKNTMLVKSLAVNPSSYPWQPEENFYPGWNSTYMNRSFWAIDENYISGVYPDQYRQALNDADVKAATTNNIYSEDYDASKGLSKGAYTLVYKSYNSYADRSDSKYSLENTFSASLFDNQDISSNPWLRSGTHIILASQLIFDDMDSDVDMTKVDASGFMEGVSDKFFSNGLYWSEKALKQQAIATLFTNIYYNKKGEQIPDVVNGGFVEYINTDEHPLDDVAPIADGEGNPLTHEDLEVNADKYFEFGPAFIKGGDGWVSLKVKDGVTLQARYKNQETGEINNVPIPEAQLVAYIYRFTNLAKHYKEGRMYYALPVRHNLASQSFEHNPVKEVATADYGVVRNTWYRITVGSILKPGTPVDDPEQPIIPNPEPDEKSLGVEVDIIPWRTVDITVDQLH